jgi:hypothetical protein
MAWIEPAASRHSMGYTFARRFCRAAGREKSKVEGRKSKFEKRNSKLGAFASKLRTLNSNRLGAEARENRVEDSTPDG